jgi:catechol 2,3-dioxygenase-like lactoylglutathione lyase family enzyme
MSYIGHKVDNLRKACDEAFMNITGLELATRDIQAQRDFYANVLELPVNLTSSGLEVKAGQTNILFTPAPRDFEGAYHFAFNIPENQFPASKEWIASRLPLLRDESGKDEFSFESWNSHSLYFKDAAGNVLEFIARHDLKNAVDGSFDGRQILQVSEIGLPAEDVLGFARELCTRLQVSVFRQQPNESFTPVGDDNGLFILPIKNRIWIPNTGVPAKLLPVKVRGEANGKTWAVRGYPYEITM